MRIIIVNLEVAHTPQSVASDREIDDRCQSNPEKDSLFLHWSGFHNLTEMFCLANNCFTSPAESVASEFFGRGKWQTTFAFEKFLQPTVAGTAFAPDDAGRDEVAHFTTKPPAFQPVFPTDRTVNRNARDF